MKPDELAEAVNEINSGVKSLIDFKDEQKQANKEVCKRLDANDQRLDEMESVVTERSANVVDLPGLKDEKEVFSFARAVNGILYGDWGRGFEKSIFEETRRERAISAGTDSAGGYWIPTNYLSEIIGLIRANSVLDKLGIRRIDNVQGSPLEIPKQTGGATAYFVGETGKPTASNLTTGLLSLRPRKVAALTQMSNRFLANAGPESERMIREDIAKVIALAVDLSAFEGVGSDNEPLGIKNTPDISTFAQSAAPDLDMIDKMTGYLEDNNTLHGNLSFVMHPKALRVIRKERIPYFSGQTDGSYVMLPRSNAKLAEDIGYGFESTTQLSTSDPSANNTTAYFGNWADMVMGVWRGMELMASNVAADGTSSAFTQDQTWLRAIMEYDVAVRHPLSFVTATSCNVSTA